MTKTSDVRLDLLQGTLDVLILRTLQWGPQHGHGIGQAIGRIMNPAPADSGK
jgi:PadR family transcriptional regulator PadR